MSEKRFKLCPVFTNNRQQKLYDCKTDKSTIIEVYDENMDYFITLLNSLSKENEQLKRRLEKINGGYGHLTHRNGLTANEWVIERQEKELKKKNEQISDWIEQHSKDIVKIGEQNKLIQNLKEENDQLRQFINKGRRLSVKELIDNANENELLKKKIKGLEKENEQLRTQLAICQQSKNNNGQIQVWEVPPIPKGMRITSFTTSDGDDDE